MTKRSHVKLRLDRALELEQQRPIALQIALAIPLIAALLGLFQSFRMTRLPDPEPSTAGEMMLA